MNKVIEISDYSEDMEPAIVVDPDGDCGSDMVMVDGHTGVWVRIGELIVYLYRPKANAIERGHDGTGVAPLGVEVYTSQRGIEAQKQVAMIVIRDSDIEETEAELAAEYGEA
jgi:hypothetical protein